MAKIEFTYESVHDGISVQIGGVVVLQLDGFEGVCDGMSEVEGVSYIFIEWVFANEFFFSIDNLW